MHLELQQYTINIKEKHTQIVKKSLLQFIKNMSTLKKNLKSNGYDDLNKLYLGCQCNYNEEEEVLIDMKRLSIYL